MIRIYKLNHAITLRDVSSRKLRIETLPQGTKLFFKGKKTMVGATGKIWTEDGFTIKQFPCREELSRLSLSQWFLLFKLWMKK